MLYFGYGSNMSREEIAKVELQNIFLRRVRLKNFRFVYDGFSSGRKSPVANIVESPKDVVWGGLYEITDGDLKKLDKKEGFPTIYQRDIFEVFDDNEKKWQAISYFRKDLELGNPIEAYRNIVLAGASDCQLP